MRTEQATVERDLENLMPLPFLALSILLLLRTKTMHGYRIQEYIKEQYGNINRPSIGSLYRTLEQLQNGELIKVSDHRPDPDVDNKKRVYFETTHLGERLALAELHRLDDFLEQQRQQGLLPENRRSVCEPRQNKTAHRLTRLPSRRRSA